METDRRPTVPPTGDALRARRRRNGAGTIVATVGLILTVVPALLALLLGLDSASDQCEPAFDDACGAAPAAFAVTVALIALPLVAGVAIARPSQWKRTIGLIAVAAVALFLLLIIVT